MYVTANYSAAMNGMDESTKMVAVTPWWQSALTALVIVMSVLTATAVCMYAYHSIKAVKKD